MSDVKQGGFFQFPLCVIAQNKSWHDILCEAFYLGVVSFIQHLKGGEEFIYSDKKAKEKFMDKARYSIGFTNGCPETFISVAKTAAEFRDEWTGLYGKTCLVRLRKDLYFGARDKEELTEKELRILLALYSMIGAKPYSKVGWPMIQARAAGHMKPVMESLIGPHHCGPIYSRGQIDRTCHELLARKLVSSFTFNRGERFWSHSLSTEELADKIENRKLWRYQSSQASAVLNSERTKKILAARALIEEAGNAH